MHRKEYDQYATMYFPEIYRWHVTDCDQIWAYPVYTCGIDGVLEYKYRDRHLCDVYNEIGNPLIVGPRLDINRRSLQKLAIKFPVHRHGGNAARMARNRRNLKALYAEGRQQRLLNIETSEEVQRARSQCVKINNQSYCQENSNMFKQSEVQHNLFEELGIKYVVDMRSKSNGKVRNQSNVGLAKAFVRGLKNFKNYNVKK